MLHRGAARAWDPPILTATATDGIGIDAVWDAIDRHRTWLADSGGLQAKRHARIVQEVGSLAAARFKVSVADALANDGDLTQQLWDRRIDPYVAASELLRRVPREEPG
jgi:LAO/AO transport system kinase